MKKIAKQDFCKINYYFINGKKYYTITIDDEAGTEIVYYKGKIIGEFN